MKVYVRIERRKKKKETRKVNKNMEKNKELIYESQNKKETIYI